MLERKDDFQDRRQHLKNMSDQELRTYFLELSENIVDKKIFSKLIIKSLKLKIEDQIDYSNDQIKGSSNLILNRKQRSAIYKIKNGNFNFNFFCRFI